MDDLAQLRARCGAFTLLLALFVGDLPCAATTITLPAAWAQTHAEDAGTHLSDSQVGYPDQIAVLGKGFAQVVGSPAPFATSSVNGGNYIASADLMYQFEIVGPKGIVPVFIRGSVTSSGSSGPSGTFYYAAAQVTLKDQLLNTTLIDTTTCSSSGDCSAYCPTASSCPSADFNIELDLIANWVYTVDLSSFAQTCRQMTVCSGLSTGTAIAAADPSIFVDPSFGGVNQYRIVLSDGIGNAVVTPEPATWLLSLASLAGIATARRRLIR